ncbi:MAG: hypothetical protein UU48_C0002G0128 [Candidatus Uhrbacteria bacterium GW2011_GWF2_41_16]|uniref:Uncharacterized protein n=2 Tax=Candidatus Uhriibacteriota TaxID=1752732 RepID=A0A0G0VCJ6_9BACT|nr:MAG: hypothetical protein UU31_C0003G0137 [Candidatus Uhrbacteria bacterium GW2011_GWA2_41_10]KKR87613.1 MAG: hypothetical protein UU35_C0002G0114 [Candidatus Uhrbacteria bacterium GW2011_GWC2_41_11]KKR98593.1 MAG: hypothetical protein UU48_C0002G0128 [Candidatus Uhrbacteria bacterium GW2011_GWF2_41_16]HBO99786.1 hypothetical protein [Candidatus Uhrbacteria bacterium]
MNGSNGSNLPSAPIAEGVLVLEDVLKILEKLSIQKRTDTDIEIILMGAAVDSKATVVIEDEPDDEMDLRKDLSEVTLSDVPLPPPLVMEGQPGPDDDTEEEKEAPDVESVGEDSLRVMFAGIELTTAVVVKPISEQQPQLRVVEEPEEKFLPPNIWLDYFIPVLLTFSIIGGAIYGIHLW